MSRRTGWAFAICVCALLAGSPLAAQSAGPGSAREVIAEANDPYGPVDTRPPKECPPQKEGEEIVVCGQLEEQSQFRVKSSGDLDPTGKGAAGPPRAPDVGTVYPGIVVARGCFVPPCPPPMPKIIDLKAIPEAPPGSDADRVARGLAPTGRDEAPSPILPPAEAESANRDEDQPVTPPGSA